MIVGEHLCQLAHALRAWPGIPSSPGALLGLTLLKDRLTSAVSSVRVAASLPTCGLVAGTVLSASNQA